MGYSKEQRIVNSLAGSTKKERNQPVAGKNQEGFVLPNNSGDHRKSIKRDAPVNDYDLVNKAYVDGITDNNFTDALKTKLDGIESGAEVNFTSSSRANQSSGQTFTSGSSATVQFNTEEYDTNSEYSTSTYKFTAAEAGIYLVTSVVTADSYAWTAGQQFSLSLYKNTDQIYVDRRTVWANLTTYMQASITTTVKLAANDTIHLTLYHNRGSNTNLRGIAQFNVFTVTRVQ